MNIAGMFPKRFFDVGGTRGASGPSGPAPAGGPASGPRTGGSSLISSFKRLAPGASSLSSGPSQNAKMERAPRGTRTSAMQSPAGRIQNKTNRLQADKAKHQAALQNIQGHGPMASMRRAFHKAAIRRDDQQLDRLQSRQPGSPQKATPGSMRNRLSQNGRASADRNGQMPPQSKAAGNPPRYFSGMYPGA